MAAREITPRANNQEDAHNPLLQGIQAEVGTENAPLLEFITRYAGLIAGIVIALLVVLGGMGLWKWHKNGKIEETRAELAKINMSLSGEAREQALRQLAQNAPESAKLFIYLTIGQNAQERGDLATASEAYALAADLDRDGSMGAMAALANVSNHMSLGKYREALALLQKLEKQMPGAASSQYMQQMLAEAALGAGDLALARDTYRKLAEELNSPQGAYYRQLAEKIAVPAKESPADKKTE